MTSSGVACLGRSRRVLRESSDRFCTRSKCRGMAWGMCPHFLVEPVQSRMQVSRFASTENVSLPPAGCSFEHRCCISWKGCMKHRPETGHQHGGGEAAQTARNKPGPRPVTFEVGRRPLVHAWYTRAADGFERDGLLNSLGLFINVLHHA